MPRGDVSASKLGTEVMLLCSRLHTTRALKSSEELS